MAKQLTFLLVVVIGLVVVRALPLDKDDGVVLNNKSVSDVQPGIETTVTPDKNATTTTPAPTDTPAPTPRGLGATETVVCGDLQDVNNCTACVLRNCTFVMEAFGPRCTNDPSSFDEFTHWVAHTAKECTNATTASTTSAPPTNATTASTTTTLPPTTNGTTIPTTTVPTTSTTTVAPVTNSTTPAAPSSTVSPTVAPSGKDSGSWGWGSFFAGIVFTAGISSVAYVVFRFYKARTDSNYHTL